MAHLEKYTAAATGHMLAHYDRTHSSSTSNIDESRIHLNYNLAETDQPLSCLDFLHKRMSEIKVLKRADVNVMCDWVITAPEDLTEDELPVFFDECYKFLTERYGRENVITAPVHMDETSPHIHYSFIPVVTDKKKGIPKLSAKERITRKDLSTFHQDLTKHMTAVFGKDIGILNGATVSGNKTIKQLKKMSENLKAFKAVPIEENSAVYKLLGIDKVVVKRSELERVNRAVENTQLISSNQDSIISDLTEQKHKADRKNKKAEERLRAAEEKAGCIIADAKTEADNMASEVSSEKAEWEKKRAEQQTILDNREKELSERSEELARAEQLVNEQAEINEASAERNLAIAAQLEQTESEIEEERRELMNQKNSPHEYYGEIIFEKNVELNSKEAEIADLCNTISEKNSKIANLDALIDEKESKIQTLNCRIVSNENAHEQRLTAALEQQEHILTEKHEKEVSELNEKISILETTLKALTNKFNDAMEFIRDMCMSVATLIFAKNEWRADLTKQQQRVIDAICNAGSALCRKFEKPELAEEIDTKYGLGDSIAEEYDRLTEKDKSRSRSNDGPCL
ncbi:chromosome segregation protein SMC [uncultured Ruminococcus sp.]|uniref:MobV family relaxase n=1 Tax=Huintestinicola butyrica TaxID=2981728 RepID=UPI000822D5F2|nr:MobV family relaxase [Huintestinicola butyrica]MCU6729050.1 plasmid recombination protein [Huintestinicola butyrica]SCJ33656.1 chromosome segregation protein SMC [uncultured Ruminococcus sp.]